MFIPANARAAKISQQASERLGQSGRRAVVTRSR
jgi:hypothetical protein